jgi:gamma-glutamylcyclotransferase (GGCT)/AIG2-like uncharacterized protein YtfP
MREVSGCDPDRVRGSLRGYGRRPVEGEQYPAVVPAAKGRVIGVVYLAVPETAWERLDRFEGDMYVRESVRIECDDGTVRTAETYVARPECSHLLGKSEWDFDEFLRSGKAGFRSGYRGYRWL